MKVSREQAAKNRAHVVEVAGAEFRQHGFDGVGISDLMKAAGLTHGGFYNNFPSKDALAAEAMTQAFDQTINGIRERIGGCSDPLASAVRYYLSPEHRDHPEEGCAVAALCQDAARGSDAIRAAFGAGIDRYLDLIADVGGVSRDRATAIYATMLGALTLSRAVADRAVSDQILASAAASILGEKNP